MTDKTQLLNACVGVLTSKNIIFQGLGYEGQKQVNDIIEAAIAALKEEANANE